MKIQDEFFIFSYEYHSCPDGMKEHKQNREQAGQAMEVELDYGTCHFPHRAGSDCITGKTKPEYHGVPYLESFT